MPLLFCRQHEAMLLCGIYANRSLSCIAITSMSWAADPTRKPRTCLLPSVPAHAHTDAHKMHATGLVTRRNVSQDAMRLRLARQLTKPLRVMFRCVCTVYLFYLNMISPLLIVLSAWRHRQDCLVSAASTRNHDEEGSHSGLAHQLGSGAQLPPILCRGPGRHVRPSSRVVESREKVKCLRCAVSSLAGVHRGNLTTYLDICAA